MAAVINAQAFDAPSQVREIIAGSKVYVAEEATFTEKIAHGLKQVWAKTTRTYRKVRVTLDQFFGDVGVKWRRLKVYAMDWLTRFRYKHPWITLCVAGVLYMVALGVAVAIYLFVFIIIFTLLLMAFGIE